MYFRGIFEVFSRYFQCISIVLFPNVAKPEKGILLNVAEAEQVFLPFSFSYVALGIIGDLAPVGRLD